VSVGTNPGSMWHGRSLLATHTDAASSSFGCPAHSTTCRLWP